MKQKIDKFLEHVIEACGVVSDAAYRAKSVHVWHSADGRVTPITEMDDRWLSNAIGCVERGKAKDAKHTRVLPFMRAELMRRQHERHPMRVTHVGKSTITVNDAVGDTVEFDPPRPHLPGLAALAERVRKLEDLPSEVAAAHQRINVLGSRVELWERGARARRFAREALEARVYSVESKLGRVVSAFERMRDEGSSFKWRNTMREIVSFVQTGRWQ